MKSPFTALKKKPFVSFLKICVQIGKLEKVLFPFSTCEGVSSDHHLKTPSRKEKLAYPYIKENDVEPLSLSFFSSPPTHPERPGAEAAGARKEEKKSGSIKLAYPVGHVHLRT